MDVEEELKGFEVWLRTHRRMGESSIWKYLQAVRKLLEDYGLERVNDFLIYMTQERHTLWVRYAVKAYLQYKERYDLLAKLPPPRHKPRKIKPRYLPDSVIERIIDTIEDRRWWLAAWIQYLTGLRAREVLMLQGTDLFKERGGIRIRVVAKGGRERFVWIVRKEIVQELRQYAGKHGYLFHNPEHKPETTYRYYWEAVRKAAEEVLGDPEFRTHDFRRNFARDALEAGVDVLTLKELLGHRRVDTTMRYVGEVAVNQRKIMKKIRG